MTDNVAILKGFTREVCASNDFYELFLLVEPDTEFDDCFEAWDIDDQKFIRVNGWLFGVE